MPEIKYYKVTRVQTVEVAANDPMGALQVASTAFEHGQDANGRQPREKTPEGVWGYTTSRIQERELKTERTS